MDSPALKKHLAWDVLLEIKRFSGHDHDFQFLCVELNHDHPEIRADDNKVLTDNSPKIIVSKQKPVFPEGNYTLFYIDNDYLLLETENNLLSETDLQLFTHYLTYSLLSYWARKHKATYAVSHFAQTLDGRIATFSGHSKWIGDSENLVHAHRMRALCDGILIGGNTLKRDRPKLTVRHVKGHTPVKIVVGNADYPFDSLLSNQDKTVFFTSHNGIHENNLEVVICRSKDGYIQPEDILQKLYEMNIYSVYIEGGAYTTSQFLTCHSLNEIQLYLAPSIMGSGIQNFSLPAIDGVQDTVKFKHHQFIKMGDGIMFAGRLNHE